MCVREGRRIPCDGDKIKYKWELFNRLRRTAFGGANHEQVLHALCPAHVI